MDSVTQAVLGAAVGVAVMGRRTAVWKAAVAGAVAGTVPDLDVLISHGDPVLDMVQHRSHSHSLFWLSLAGPVVGWLLAQLLREGALGWRWAMAIWLAFLTHPMLDACTVYGTQLLQPFSDRPYGLGSIFIIDPFYTVPLILGTAWALRSHGSPRGLAVNRLTLALSTVYLGWGVAVQHHIEAVARESLVAHGVSARGVLVTPAAFTSVLWRVVAIDDGHYYEGFRSLLDKSPHIAFERYHRGAELEPLVTQIDAVRRLQSFSHGFYRLAESGGRLAISDLRMGMEPNYLFTFEVAERHSAPVPLIPTRQVGMRVDLARAWPWYWRRLAGEPVSLRQ
jgi:inner membrane protein